MLVVLAFATAPRARAQAAGQLVFTGTAYTNLGQPVPTGTPVAVVTASTNLPCGQGVVGAAGSFSVSVTPAAPCNAVGTSLVFQFSGVAATPIAFVTASSGVMLISLTVAGLPVSSSGTTSSGALTPPSTPPAGANGNLTSGGALVPPANAPASTASTAGALIPPTTPPAQTGTQATTSALGNGSAAATQPSQAAAHTVSESLRTGCNQVVVSFGTGAQPAQIVSAVVNPSAVLSVWHFDNASQRYSGYFPAPGVPSDLTTLSPVDAVFICVGSDTTINAPQP